MMENNLQKLNKEELRKFINVNADARHYFFTKADDHWLDWLWENGFLDGIKKKSEDPTRYSYNLPEIEYLMKVAEKKPDKVTEIILSPETATREENFNPGVISRFLWIIGVLPGQQIKKITEKIRNEEWIYLMRNFRETGYRFTGIVRKLVESKEGKALLELAQALLSVKSQQEIAERVSVFGTDDPFYIDYIEEAGIFEALIGIEEPYLEEALKVTTDIMAEIIKLSESDSSKVFEYSDFFYLSDVDFFELKIENKKSVAYREDIKNLAATIKNLVQRTIGKKCDNSHEAKRLFNYIDRLPSCRSMWRLRLFTIAQCPETFKAEIKAAYFRVFEVGERYFEIEEGAEYYRLLNRCFNVLESTTDQREYVGKVFDYFGASLEDKEQEKWRKRDGLKILTFIKDYLTPQEKEMAKEKFGKYPNNEDFVLEPRRMMYAGSISDKSPVNLDDFTVQQIIGNLKSEWTPEKLKEKYKDDRFDNPRNAEGLGNALKENIKKRTDAYLKEINSFFDEKINPHYVYFILRGIEEMLRNKQSFNIDQISQILGFFEFIKNGSGRISFEKEDDHWLISWIPVHKVIADILLFILSDKDENKRKEIHKLHRERIRDIILYLFTVKNSPSKEEEQKPDYGEPYHIAINSVRGRTFEAFVVFTENDGKVLFDDTKKLYEQVLQDDSLAVRFVIGRYLATFYFRDVNYVTNNFPKIFPKDDPVKKDIYLATWEGYLSNTLYDKLFTTLQEYYEHAIAINPENYTKRKYWKGLDESLAIHLALAFVYLGMDMDNPLFKQFWATQNTKRHKEFISFIGQSCLAKNEDTQPNDRKIDKEKLIKFWNWVLENVSDSEILSGFGFWVNPHQEILDDSVVVEKLAQTMKKSDGDIEWDYGFLHRLKSFAEKNDEKTLEIIKSYLLDSSNNLNKNRRVPFLYDKEIKDALNIIYDNGSEEAKQKIKDLINTLIEKGGSIFWPLKDILK